MGSKIETELAHRKKQKGKDNYNPYAGPYDITLVKLNKFVDFEEGKVRKSPRGREEKLPDGTL